MTNICDFNTELSEEARAKLYGEYFLIYNAAYADCEKWRVLSNLPDRNKGFKSRCAREFESTVEHAGGFSGKSTGLITVEALVTRIRIVLFNEKVSKQDSLAEEHPITKRSLVNFLMDPNTDWPTFDEFWALWDNYIITVITTNSQNHGPLKTHQQSFKFGDCWLQSVYNPSGMVLIDNPPLRSYAEKRAAIDWYNTITGENREYKCYSEKKGEWIEL